jgi:hypothetical protein
MRARARRTRAPDCTLGTDHFQYSEPSSGRLFSIACSTAL